MFISIGIIIATIFIHGMGTTYLVVYLYRKQQRATKKWGFREALKALSFTALLLLLLHLIEVTIWASIYLLIPDIQQLSSFEEALYFSMATFTTLGYGDIVLERHWRIMSGFEAMNGILLFGWSTAMLFSSVQRILGQLMHRVVDHKQSIV
jgi:voltage-gated potassium channel Kch